MASKILISNYPRISQSAQFQCVEDGHKLDILTGYDINPDPKEVTMSIVSDMINAILTYEEVYIEAIHLADVVQVFGIEAVKLFLREGILHIIPDQSLNPVMKRSSEHFEPGFFGYSVRRVKAGDTIAPLNQVSKWDHLAVAFDKKGLDSKESDVLLYLVDEHSIQIKENDVSRIVIEEVKRDIASALFNKAYDIARPIEGKFILNTPQIIRLLELNKTCVLGGMLGMDSIHCDSDITKMLKAKAFAHVAGIKSDGVDALQTIEIQKGMPDIGQLFYAGYLSLDDVLKIRQSIQGKLFRYWAAKVEYDPALMLKDVSNSVSGFLSTDIGKLCRVATCGVAGVIGLIPGLAASAIDSFILEKISKGWQPNLFLDGKLGKLLDEGAKKQERELRRQEIERHFKGVGRNDPCPCGSGLKYKKCHGKDL